MPDGRGERGRQVREWLPALASLVPLAAVVTFVVQNGDDVEVDFLWMHPELPLGGALLLSAVLGGLVALFLGFVRRRRRD